ncbi:MAG: competence/damage-inducible protein A [Eubacteriales bacterium]
MMTAEILSIGTELLLGDTVNTNAAEIGKILADLSIDCYYQTVVGDNPERLRAAVENAFSRADMVITTGGLGPTYDDITKDIVADYFGQKLVYDEKSLANVRELFRRINRHMTDNNLRQALVIEGCTVLDNEHGLAPGIYFEKNGKTAVMLPGPPSEMLPILKNKLFPLLQKSAGFTLVSRNLRIFGVGESKIEDTLHEMMVSGTNPTIAPYAKHGEVTVRVTARATSRDAGLDIVSPVVEEIKSIFGDAVYAVDTPDLQTALVETLKTKKKTISLAESCTGGLIAKKITEIAGSSEVFGYGAVTYANEAKVKLLGVKEKTLEENGAVSPETATEMAEGIRSLSGADIGLAVTGIAGPGGGTEEKPVGLVYIGVSTKNGTETHQFLLSRGREEERDSIRERASKQALYIALKKL